MPLHVSADLQSSAASNTSEKSSSPGIPQIRVHWAPGFDGNSPILRYIVEVRTSAIGTSAETDSRKGNGAVQWSEWDAVQEVNTDGQQQADCCTAFIDGIRPAATAEFRVVCLNVYDDIPPTIFYIVLFLRFTTFGSVLIFPFLKKREFFGFRPHIFFPNSCS